MAANQFSNSFGSFFGDSFGSTKEVITILYDSRIPELSILFAVGLPTMFVDINDLLYLTEAQNSPAVHSNSSTLEGPNISGIKNS